MQLKIVKEDGSDIATDDVFIINLCLQTMWKEVQVFWQNRAVSMGHLHPYKAMIDTLLSYGYDSISTQLQMQAYFKETANYMDKPNTSRKSLTEGGKSVQLEGSLMVDVCQQPFLIPNGVQVRIKLVPHSHAFCLNSSIVDTKYKLKVEDVKFLACLVTLNPEDQGKVEERLKKTTLKYPIQGDRKSVV